MTAVGSEVRHAQNPGHTWRPRSHGAWEPGGKAGEQSGG